MREHISGRLRAQGDCRSEDRQLGGGSAFVLDGDQRSALATVRSLGSRGVSVWVGAPAARPLAGASRYCIETVVYPPPEEDPTAFRQLLSEVCAQHGVDVLFPMTDLTTSVVLAGPEEYARAKLPCAGLGKYLTLSNKCELLKRARKLGVPIPRSDFVRAGDEAEEAGRQLGYPLVLKPCLSVMEAGGRWLRTAVKKVDSAAAMRQAIGQEAYFQGVPFLVQEYIPGHGAGIFALYDSGEPVTFFAHRRIREKPPEGGVSVLSESVKVAPSLRDYAERILSAAGWHGAAMVEFRIDKDGSPYLMEVNARLWGSVQLAVDAGIDFPYLLYGLARGESLAPVQDYELGLKNRWLIGDLDHLWIVARDTLKGQRTARQLGVCAGSFLASFFDRHVRCEVSRRGDMGPFFREVRHYLGG